MQFELSICIPTYNRAKYLKDAINSIISQIDYGNRDTIEICISDNASCDNTKELIESFRKIHPHITYFCHDTNMGADTNYLKAIEIAHGKYCWFFGSDDIMEPGAIKRIYKEIQDGDTDIFCINNISYDINMQNPVPAVHSMWKNKNDIVFKNHTDCISSMGEMFGYLSAFIFKKGKWDKFAVEKKFIGSAYSHTYILYSILKNGGVLKYISHPFVGHRGGNDSFLTDGTIKRMSLDIFGYDEISADVFGKNSIERRKLNNIILNQYVFGYVFRMVLSGEATLKYRIQAFKITFKQYGSFLSFWVKIFPILIMPFFMMKLIRFFYRITIKNIIKSRNQKRYK